jgi:CheY-like chemotaxis protein
MPNDRILVVEDDDGLREAIACVLEDGGFEVAAVENAADAIDRMRFGGVGLVLLDLGLKVLSGQAFMEWCRREPSLSVVPVVLVSGEADLPRLTRRFGAVGYIRKPFDATALLDVAHRWIPGRRSQSA